MTRVNWLGAVIWMCALTTGLWAPHRPPLVAGLAAIALAVIGLVLIFWPRQ